MTNQREREKVFYKLVEDYEKECEKLIMKLKSYVTKKKGFERSIVTM